MKAVSRLVAAPVCARPRRPAVTSYRPSTVLWLWAAGLACRGLMGLDLLA